MADRVIMLPAMDSNGNPVSGATAYFYERGTFIPLVVYADVLNDVELGVTITANAAGIFPPVFTVEGVRIDVRNPADASLPGYPSDNWYVVPTVGLGAGTITFEPILGNAGTTVAEAIGNLTGLWNAVTAYGRGLIGSAGATEARTSLGLGTAATKDIIDEDSFATDSATRPPSQKSTKAYVGAKIDGLFKCRAWVNFSGTGTPSIRGSGNVSSITDNGTGDYTVNFTTPLANANYAAVGSWQNAALPDRGGQDGPVIPRQQLSTSIRIWLTDGSSNAADGSHINIAIFQ